MQKQAGSNRNIFALMRKIERYNYDNTRYPRREKERKTCLTE